MAGVKIVDHGYEAFVATMKETAEYETTAGVYEDDEDVMNYAIINEFGNSHQRPRPFMRLAAAKAAEEIADEEQAVAGEIIDGKIQPRMGLQRVAAKLRDAIKDQIANGGTPPANEPATVAKKGHGVTLNEEGRLYNSIKAKVKRK